MEDIKVRVINALIADASRSRKELSHELGVSESYISKIVKELELEKKIEKFTIKVNYKAFHYNNHAYSLIRLKRFDPAFIESFAAGIVKLNQAVEVFTILGDHHLYVRWICQDPEDIMRNINSVLGSSDVESIETFTLGTAYKRVIGPDLPLAQEP